MKEGRDVFEPESVRCFQSSQASEVFLLGRQALPFTSLSPFFDPCIEGHVSRHAQKSSFGCVISYPNVGKRIISNSGLHHLAEAFAKPGMSS